MKTLTKEDLTYLIQNAGDLFSAEKVTKIELTAQPITDCNGDPDEYYESTVNGTVRYHSKQEGIEIKFNFIARAGGYEYADAYDFEVFIDSDTFEISGFVLVDEDGEKLGKTLTEYALENEFNGRGWETDVKYLLPTLP